ncbi:hypothetical protein FA13DRAFT_1735423 [Coprinellus micaceus]|uniref:Uncharacterized protein n=1 Tax=Coprinellus micaceus TaxID=71717 RepID=A0A4Y7T379_COPMI|nr:hypothetical protein FA13DRAFT_1735423 [Coprinellus micaceus]
MDVSAEQVEALASAVAVWRMQEYIVITFYCLYTYYILTTISDELSVILRQRWNRGKMLHAIIRYGTLVFIALQLTRDYRNYFSVSPMGCKALHVIYDAVLWITTMACDFSLALCLTALLQGRLIHLVGVVTLSCAVPFVNSAMNLVAQIQYPAEQVSQLDEALGYPCYSPSAEAWVEETVAFIGRGTRGYVNLVATILLALLGVATLVIRYNGQGGRLVQVIRRDGGRHYISQLVIRLVSAIVQTPSVIQAPELETSPVFVLINMATIVIIPILAQRLLLNMRKVDYMGSEPFASKLLFAPPIPGEDDDPEAGLDSFEMAPDPSGLCHRDSAGKGFEGAGVGVPASNA